MILFKVFNFILVRQTTKQQLKGEFYLAIDSIISNFSWRYEQMEILTSDFGLFLEINKKSEDVCKLSNYLAMKYSKDLNETDF